MPSSTTTPAPSLRLGLFTLLLAISPAIVSPTAAYPPGEGAPAPSYHYEHCGANMNMEYLFFDTFYFNKHFSIAKPPDAQFLKGRAKNCGKKKREDSETDSETDPTTDEEQSLSQDALDARSTPSSDVDGERQIPDSPPTHAVAFPVPSVLYSPSQAFTHMMDTHPTLSVACIEQAAQLEQRHMDSTTMPWKAAVVPYHAARQAVQFKARFGNLRPSSESASTRGLCPNILPAQTSSVTSAPAELQRVEAEPVFRIFFGQLRKECDTDFVEFLLFHVIGLPMEAVHDVVMHTAPPRPEARPKGCAWVDVRGKAALDTLLSFHHRLFLTDSTMFGDESSFEEFIIVVDQSCERELKHLSGILENADGRNNDLLSKGPIVIEAQREKPESSKNQVSSRPRPPRPLVATSAAAEPSRPAFFSKVLERPSPQEHKTRWRYDPYATAAPHHRVTVSSGPSER